METVTLIETPPADPAASPAPSPVIAPRPRRTRRTAVVAIAVIVLTAGALVTWLSLRSRPVANVMEATGTVEATEAVLGFAAGGRIRTIALPEGEKARVGAELAALDTSELMAHVRQLEDQATLAEAQLRELELGSRPQELDDHEQTVIAARRSLDDAELDLRRMQALIERGAISQQTLDKTQLARDVAATKYAQAQAGLSLAREGTRRQQVSASRAALAAARSQLVSLVATIPNYFIHSPWTGVVTDRAHEPGEAVSAGAPILTVMNPGDRWVRIYIPENQIGAVGLGQRAAITSDAFPNHPLAGHVRWIADEAEFTPRNVETKDDRVRLVYAAKIQIDGDSAMVLKPGTPADVRITLARAPTP